MNKFIVLVFPLPVDPMTCSGVRYDDQSKTKTMNRNFKKYGGKVSFTRMQESGRKLGLVFPIFSLSPLLPSFPIPSSRSLGFGGSVLGLGGPVSDIALLVKAH